MKFKSIIFGLLLVGSAFVLSSCVYMLIGDKTHEYLDCPVNKETGNYEVKLDGSHCKKENIYPSVLNIPQEHNLVCSTSYPVPEDRHIESIRMNVTYPEMHPVNKMDREKAKNVIVIWLNPSCDGNPSIYDKQKESDRIAEYIRKNEGYTQSDGSKHFSPIKDFGNGIYFQENIRKDGNASVYFYKDDEGIISFMMLCNSLGECSSHANTSDYAFNYSYRSYGIGYENFYDVRQKVNTFIESLYSKDN
jgi:hypothetical protein